MAVADDAPKMPKLAVQVLAVLFHLNMLKETVTSGMIRRGV